MYRRPYLLTALVCFGLLASSFAYFPITTTIARETSPNQPDDLPGWSWYQQVTINNPGGSLTDYQVRINLNAGNFASGFPMPVQTGVISVSPIRTRRPC